MIVLNLAAFSISVCFDVAYLFDHASLTRGLPHLDHSLLAKQVLWDRHNGFPFSRISLLYWIHDDKSSLILLYLTISNAFERVWAILSWVEPVLIAFDLPENFLANFGVALSREWSSDRCIYLRLSHVFFDSQGWVHHFNESHISTAILWLSVNLSPCRDSIDWSQLDVYDRPVCIRILVKVIRHTPSLLIVLLYLHGVLGKLLLASLFLHDACLAINIHLCCVTAKSEASHATLTGHVLDLLLIPKPSLREATFPWLSIIWWRVWLHQVWGTTILIVSQLNLGIDAACETLRHYGKLQIGLSLWRDISWEHRSVASASSAITAENPVVIIALDSRSWVEVGGRRATFVAIALHLSFVTHGSGTLVTALHSVKNWGWTKLVVHCACILKVDNPEVVDRAMVKVKGAKVSLYPMPLYEL